MEKAVIYYKQGHGTLEQSADKFSVPRSTLHTRLI